MRRHRSRCELLVRMTKTSRDLRSSVGPVTESVCASATPRRRRAGLAIGLITLVSLFGACNRELEQTDEVMPTQSDVVLLPGVGGIAGVAWLSDTLVAVLDRRGAPFITIVNVRTGSIVRQGVRSGGGPGELRSPTALWRSTDGALAVFEPNQRRVVQFEDPVRSDQASVVDLTTTGPRMTLPPEGVLQSSAGIIVSGPFGDTTAIFVPASPDATPRAVLTGPHYRATTEPVPLFNANWHATSVDAERGLFAMAFRFAPLLVIVDSLGAVVHERRVGTTGAPRRDPESRAPAFSSEASDVASLAVSIRGGTVALLYCGCDGATVTDSARNVQLFAWEDSTMPRSFRFSGRVRALALSPDATRLVVGLEDPEPHLEVVLLDRSFKESAP